MSVIDDEAAFALLGAVVRLAIREARSKSSSDICRRDAIEFVWCVAPVVAERLGLSEPEQSGAGAGA